MKNGIFSPFFLEKVLPPLSDGWHTLTTKLSKKPELLD